jgi:hypothetical protein
MIAAGMMTANEVWRRQVRFLGRLAMILAQIPPVVRLSFPFNLQRLCRYLFVFFGSLELSIPLPLRPLSLRPSFVLNLLSDTH